MTHKSKGCGDGAESGDGRAASASPRVEEPPPVPPAVATAPLPVPPDVSPTADSWEAEADDALLTPEDNNEAEEEELEQQVTIHYYLHDIFLYNICNACATIKM